MFRRTVKNARRLKWFSFAMFILGLAAFLGFAKMAADGAIDSIAWGVVGAFTLPAMWLFWFFAFDAFTEIEEDIAAEQREKGRRNDR